MGGSLTEDELLRHATRQGMKVFVETGTYKGESTRIAAKLFEEVYTMEISPVLYDQAKRSAKAAGLNTNGYLFGDSVQLLERLLTHEIESKPTFFFIDAHISDHLTSYNGVELVPALSELRLINDLYPVNLPGIICVDDLRLFDGPPDWKGIHETSIKEALNNHIIEYSEIENDRYYIYLNMKKL